MTLGLGDNGNLLLNVEPLRVRAGQFGHFVEVLIPEAGPVAEKVVVLYAAKNYNFGILRFTVTVAALGLTWMAAVVISTTPIKRVTARDIGPLDDFELDLLHGRLQNNADV